jgi:hypothetical protein
MQHVKAAVKAEAIKSKKNLEGNSLPSQNSFAVLGNKELMIRANKMGVNTANIELEQIDVLKDIELARDNLQERNEKLKNEKEPITHDTLPFEEVKMIEWHSDTSEDEGFQLVTTRKKIRKRKVPLLRESVKQYPPTS